MEFIKHNISAKGELHYCAEQLKIHGKYTQAKACFRMSILWSVHACEILKLFIMTYIYPSQRKKNCIYITTSAILRINKCLLIICSRQTIA